MGYMDRLEGDVLVKNRHFESLVMKLLGVDTACRMPWNH